MAIDSKPLMIEDGSTLNLPSPIASGYQLEFSPAYKDTPHSIWLSSPIYQALMSAELEDVGSLSRHKEYLGRGTTVSTVHIPSSDLS